MRNNLGWKSCRADPDVWLRPAVKSDNTPYYEYLFIHTDDLLCVSENPREALDQINSYFLLKPESVGEPSTYLGGQISKFYIEGGAKWAYGSERYVKEALRVIKKKLDEYGMCLKAKTNTVLPSGYRPELDSTPELEEDEATFYMQAVGILRWIVELGRVDICCEVSMMAAYNACPREGHIEAVMHIFSYLSCHERSRLVFDDAYPKHEIPKKENWQEFYPEATDVLPPDMPEPRGKPVQITMFVDASHAANLVTRQSRSGILIYCNLSLILWYSKRQNSIETSSFGSEFMALKTGFEMLEGLRYKLRMMGVPIDGPAIVMVDNMSVVRNTSVPESQLRKKSNSIAYHYVRERCAADIARICYVNPDDNLADMLTKIQPGTKRAALAQR
ncbi:MAG: Ty1/Copia family ribonuclease HI, partial [Nodosilinea sp.]